MSSPDPDSRYTFVLKLDDRPGAMELVAATFAHRGVSLTSSLGNDGTLDPVHHAVILITFTATPTKKEVLKRALSRLSRVISLVEYLPGDVTMRKSALVRVRAPLAHSVQDMPDVNESNLSIQHIETDPRDGDLLYALLGTPASVDALLEATHRAGNLRAVTQTVLAL